MRFLSDLDLPLASTFATAGRALLSSAAAVPRHRWYFLRSLLASTPAAEERTRSTTSGPAAMRTRTAAMILLFLQSGGALQAEPVRYELARGSTQVAPQLRRADEALQGHTQRGCAGSEGTGP